jgi:hypothetical protein
MTSRLLALLIAGCTTETEPKQFNNAPTVEIQSHSDGSELEEGVATQFYAMVSDLNDPNEDLLASWYIGDELACDWAAPDSAGITRCELSLTSGDSLVAVVVTDPAQVGSRDEIEVSVAPTEAPTAAIVSPIVDGSYYSDQLISFKASVSDVEDGPEELSSTWTSSLDGELVLDTTADSSGELEDYGYLSEGQHAIEFTVADSGGKTASESVVLQVGGPNSKPECGITEPSDGSGAVLGQSVVFRGFATDADIDNELLSVTWTSDKDGELGTASPNSDGSTTLAINTLSSDLHSVTISVADEVGGNCSASILLSVGSAPTVSLSNPLDGSVHNLGESILFSAEVTDTEDIPSAVALSWSSDLDGTLSSQGATSSGTAQFSSSTLSAGQHTLTVTATDTAGLTADALASFRVNTPPPALDLSISPSPASTLDSLQAAATSEGDADGDSLSYSYEWLQDGNGTSYSSASVPSSATSKNEVWTLRAWASDAYVSGPVSETNATIANTPPSIQNLALLPYAPSTSDLLTCTATVNDPDEIPTLSYVWTLPSAGAIIGIGDSLDLASTALSSGDIVQCEATATDGDLATDSETATVEIQNAAPFITDVDISPAAPGPTSLLECSVVAADPDGDALSATFSWHNATTGSGLGSGAQLQLDNANASSGDSIECTATVDDGNGGTDSAAAAAEVSNTSPEISQAAIAPASGVLTDSLLECSAEASDTEDGALAPSYAWSNATTGSSLGSGSQLQLDSSISSPGDEIECEATATDSSGASISSSADVTVENAGPSFTDTASISPATGIFTGTALECSAGALDPDGGSVTIDYAWSSGGVLIASGTQYTVDPGDTDPGDGVLCTATATDADGGSAESSSTVTVENTLPSITGIALDPAAIGTYGSISCTASLSDLDGDTPTASYVWTNLATAAEIGTSETLVLDSTQASVADQIECVLTATDAHGGSASGSADFEVQSTPPIFTSPAAIDPSAGVGISSTLSCLAEAVDELGAALAISYEWTLADGTPLGSASASSAGASLSLSGIAYSGDSIVCTATATDSGGESSVSTDTVTVGNSLPEAEVLSLVSSGADPGTAHTDDTLTVSVSGSDADGEAVEYSYSWLVDGAEAFAEGPTASASSSLDGAVYFERDQTVQVQVTPTDGTDSGAAVLSDTVSIANSVPSAPTASVSPVAPEDHEDIVCSASGSTDADSGDSPTYSYSWTQDGADRSDLAGQDTVPASETAPGEEWSCTASASDGTDSASASATANVESPCPDDDGDGADCDDCDDADPFTYPGAAYLESASACMRDEDGDGWGDDLTDNCCYTLEMTDLSGDGWDGAYLQLFDDGVLQGTYTVGAASESELLCVPDGHLLSLSYSDGGTEADNTYTLHTPDGSLVGFWGPNPARGQVYSDTVDYSTLATCGLATEGTDCDDTDAGLNLDDADGDFETSCGGDCEDGLDHIQSSTDLDADGHPYCSDCDDDDPSAYPGAAQLDSVHDCMRDSDSDGWGDDLSTDCCYSLEMTDNYNGAWDGGHLTAYADGVLIGTYAAAGSSAGEVQTAAVCLRSGESFTLEYTAGAEIPSYEEENSYMLYSPDGSLLYEDGPTPSEGTAFEEILYPSDYATCFHGDEGSDCDDEDALLNQEDADGDGVSSCEDDCSDADSAVGDIALDADCDGSLAVDDCDDTDPLRAPDLEEICGNGIDEDCSGTDLSCFEEVTFSSCGLSGPSGPSQSDCDSEYTGTTLDGEVTLQGGIQVWTVPASALYRIETWGAASGEILNYAVENSGRGAYISGDFELEEGDVLQILVGQQGEESLRVGGPGGGTFVVTEDDSPLIIAGGAGAARDNQNDRDGQGDSSVDATDSETAKSGGDGCTGGSAGSGGQGCGYPGGGGFSGNGADGTGGATGGISFLNGGQGGPCTASCYSNSGAGGFGGGGGTWHDANPGGGGGYSGGGGGSYKGGGGGGSYNSGSNQSSGTGDSGNTGSGQVTITLAE